MLRDILKEVQNNMVPRGLLKEWALHTFLTSTDYWTFRKTVSQHSCFLGQFELKKTDLKSILVFSKRIFDKHEL